MVMKTIPAGKFKAHCLRIMDEVQASREPVLITKKGRPVAKLVPAETQAKDIFGCLRNEITIVGDIESPVVPWQDWDALR
jgi:prevent-host-death family protein